MLDKQQIKLLKKLYNAGASYKLIANTIKANVKEIDNFIYSRGLSKGRRVGQRGGSSSCETIAPVHRLRKDEIVWLSKHYCKKHGKSFLTCYNCFLEENPNMCRIGHFDLECSDLAANYGLLLSYAILDNDSDRLFGRTITKEELYSDEMDTQITDECVRDLYNFDVIVTYFGTRFDLPYIRTRAVMNGLEFPTYDALKHIDLFYVIKTKFKLQRKSLEKACRSLLGTTRKTEILPYIIPRCIQGNEKALEYMWEHNVYDVEDTKELYQAVIDYRYPGKRSV